MREGYQPFWLACADTLGVCPSVLRAADFICWLSQVEQRFRKARRLHPADLIDRDEWSNFVLNQSTAPATLGQPQGSP